MGILFAIGLENNSVRLYDLRNFDKVSNRVGAGGPAGGWVAGCSEAHLGRECRDPSAWSHRTTLLPTSNGQASSSGRHVKNDGRGVDKGGDVVAMVVIVVLVCSSLTSTNGRDLLVSTRQEKLYVVDTLEYRLQHTFTDYENKAELALEASFTPDGKYILSGRLDEDEWTTTTRAVVSTDL